MRDGYWSYAMKLMWSNYVSEEFEVFWSELGQDTIVSSMERKKLKVISISATSSAEKW